MDSRNGIEHKCPCCGYEVEWDWSQPRGNEMVKGDESFIRVRSDISLEAKNESHFLTSICQNGVLFIILELDLLIRKMKMDMFYLIKIDRLSVAAQIL